MTFQIHRRGAGLLAAGLATFGLMITSAPLSAQDPAGAETLTLQDAIEIARANNPQLRAVETERGAARSAVRSAYGDFLPQLSAGTSVGYTAAGTRRFGDVDLAEQPAVYSSGYNLGMSYSMSGATMLQPRLAQAREQATHARIEGEAAGLESQVSQNYLAVLQADAEYAQATVEVERTDTYVRQAEARLAVGAATPLDVRRAEVQRGQAEFRQLQAENARYRERLALSRLMGVALPEDVALTTDFELFAPEWDVEALVRTALERNPALRAMEAQATASDTQLRVARSRYLPSVGLNATLFQGSVLQRSGEEDGPSFPFGYQQQPANMSFSVSIPLFTGFDRRLATDEARAASTAAQENVRAEELRLRSEVATAARTVETAYRGARLQAQVRETAAEELRLAQERFRQGAGTSVEVVDAQTNLSEAEREEINAIYEFHRSLAGLEAMLGRTLRPGS